MHCQKVRRVLRYHVPNKLLSLQNKLQEQGVQDVVNRNKIKFGYLLDQAFSQFNENSINNQDPHSQIENDEIPGTEYPNENDLEDTETNKTSAIPNFMPQILPDDEIAKGINSLNSKQREVINYGSYMGSSYFT